MYRKFVVLLIVAVVLTTVPAMAAKVVESGGTVIAGEVVDLPFVDQCPGATFGWWASPAGVFTTEPTRTIDLSNYNGYTFDPMDFKGYNGQWLCYNKTMYGFSNDEQYRYRMEGPRFVLIVPVITTEPTPAPTPSEGNIIISSYPSDATVYVDNVIKGITPLTVSVPNGDHLVRLRLDGYQESKTSVTVTGADVSIEPELIPVTTLATTIPTTIPTTSQTTVLTTIPTTAITTVPTPIQTTATIDYSSTIAAIQSQVAEHDTKIQEQQEEIGVLQQILNSIMKLLGLQ
jgi:hypothetical protein